MHALVSIQNILMYLVHFLTQKLLSIKQMSMLSEYNVCELGEMNEDEKSMFIQCSFLYVNNMCHLHLHTFKKVFCFKL